MTTRPYYECHITIIGEKSYVQPHVECVGWTFSAIDKDIILGEGVKCYATKHFNQKLQPQHVQAILDQASDELRALGCAIIRKKIEKVLYDERIKK